MSKLKVNELDTESGTTITVTTGKTLTVPSGATLDVSAGAITGIDSEGNTFSYTAVAGATLPFFVARVNTSAGATQLVAFIDND